MASNPMQRQKRISFWLGVIVTFLICSVIICGLGFMLYTKIKAEIELKESMKTVYVLKSDVKSGQVVMPEMLKSIEVNQNTIPKNAISDAKIFKSYQLQDEKGNLIYQDSEGLYIGTSESTNTSANTNTTEDSSNTSSKTTKIRIIEKDGKYVKVVNGQEEYITLKQLPLIAKVNMKANTIITRELVAQSDEVNTKDVRVQEYNIVNLPTTIATGDFIDIRLRLPNGVDYIVVSKKEITIPEIDGIPASDTIDVKMSEDEILTMSNAIVEAYIMNGSELYATKYSDPGNQEKSVPTYPVSQAVLSLINDTSGDGKNILETAKQALWNRYNVNQRNQVVQPQLDQYSEEATDNVETNIEKQIQRQKELREKYLQALNAEASN